MRVTVVFHMAHLFEYYLASISFKQEIEPDFLMIWNEREETLIGVHLSHISY